MTISSFDDIRALMATMPHADAAAVEAAQARDSQLTKPPGALGKLEHLALWLAAWQGRNPPRAQAIQFLVFAGNHGVTAQGISAFPAEVTVQMVANFQHGGAAINQLARLAGADLTVIPLELERPTGDFCAGPAMSEAETCAAFQAGFEAAKDGDLCCIGEMGIGNTTVAAALAAALFGGDGQAWAGPGTGLDPKGVNRKAQVIDRGLALHRERLGDPLQALACLGGREIAAMAGAILACRIKRVPVLLDGYVNCAAAAVLKRLDDTALDHCRAGHRSAEPAAGRLLGALDMDRSLEPLLDLGMRLGECSGAAVAALIVKAAVATHAGMATFAEAGVAGKDASNAMAQGAQDAAETRQAILLARGVCRLFDAMGHACLTEVTVKNGRRADVLAMDGKGRFTIVEIKTSLADFRADAKWGEYLEFCDRYYFAVPQHFPQEVLPEDHGLIVADAWDATILRPSEEAAMNGARRKAQTLHFAQLAARRLRLLLDPPV